MILLLMEMMNQSLGTCPNFGVQFKHPIKAFLNFGFEQGVFQKRM